MKVTHHGLPEFVRQPLILLVLLTDLLRLLVIVDRELFKRLQHLLHFVLRRVILRLLANDRNVKFYCEVGLTSVECS